MALLRSKLTRTCQTDTRSSEAPDWTGGRDASLQVMQVLWSESACGEADGGGLDEIEGVQRKGFTSACQKHVLVLYLQCMLRHISELKKLILHKDATFTVCRSIVRRLLLPIEQWYMFHFKPGGVAFRGRKESDFHNHGSDPGDGLDCFEPLAARAPIPKHYARTAFSFLVILTTISTAFCSPPPSLTSQPSGTAPKELLTTTFRRLTLLHCQASNWSAVIQFCACLLEASATVGLQISHSRSP